jgi:L-asparagine transporter-like permease
LVANCFETLVNCSPSKALTCAAPLTFKANYLRSMIGLKVFSIDLSLSSYTLLWRYSYILCTSFCKSCCALTMTIPCHSSMCWFLHHMNVPWECLDMNQVFWFLLNHGGALVIDIQNND